MSPIRPAVTRAAQTIHRFPSSANVSKNFVAFYNKLYSQNVTAADLKKKSDEHLAACKAASAAPEGFKVLSNGRISLKNKYFGRGYIDQNRSPVTGQTVHEIHEALRRTPEPIEGFKMTGPYFLAQIQDHKLVSFYFFPSIFR